MLWITAQSFAQTLPITSEQGEFLPEAPAISTLVDEVHLTFIVTDPKGRFVKSLDKSQFQFLDDGRPPERILQFHASSNSPLRVSLLFDISSSVRYRLDFEQKAAKHFFKDILRPQSDQANVIAFGSDVKEVQRMTSSVATLSTAVGKLHAGGDTALYDAIIRASADLNTRTRVPDARKVIVIVSDGADTASRHTEEQCTKAAVSSEATIVVVDASIPLEQNTPGQNFLRTLALNSGGLVLPARQDSELKSAFHKIEAMLRNQYALSYKPASFERDGKYRSIEVTALASGLKVHSRKGYYARVE